MNKRIIIPIMLPPTTLANTDISATFECLELDLNMYDHLMEEIYKLYNKAARDRAENGIVFGVSTDAYLALKWIIQNVNKRWGKYEAGVLQVWLPGGPHNVYAAPSLDSFNPIILGGERQALWHETKKIRDKQDGWGY